MKSCLILLLGLIASPLFADGLPSEPYVYVKGRAEIQVQPDRFDLTFDATATNLDEAKAKAEVAEQAQRVFALLTRLGIPDDQITAYAISVRPDFEFADGKRQYDGTNVTRSFKVELNKAALFPQLIDGLIEAKISTIENPVERVSNEATLRADLVERAVQDARDRAAVMAKESGVRLGSVFAISPVPPNQIINRIFGEAESGAPTLMGAVTFFDTGGIGKFVFGKTTLAEEVHVIFLLKPAN